MSLAVLCSGQGGQHAALLEILTGSQPAEEVLAEGELALGECLHDWLERPDHLFQNRIAQPLICLVQLARWSALKERIPAPAAFAGYSVGELASYGCAAALGAQDLARLANCRAAMMDSAAGPQKSSGLCAVSGLLRAEVTALCSGRQAWIAIANGEDAFVVGGVAADLEAFLADCGARGASITRLPVGLAAHTPLVRSAVAPFAEALEQSALRAPATPVVAGIDAAWVTDRTAALAKLAAQLATTIEWARCLDALFERGCRVFLELGPGSSLAQMVSRRFGAAAFARSVDDFRTLDGIASWVEQRSLSARD